MDWRFAAAADVPLLISLRERATTLVKQPVTVSGDGVKGITWSERKRRQGRRPRKAPGRLDGGPRSSEGCGGSLGNVGRPQGVVQRLSNDESRTPAHSIVAAWRRG
jgi:hypothetical protein